MTVPVALPQAHGVGREPAGRPLSQRIGFEIELLAPLGSSRADLAHEVAARCGGSVRRFFHTDSEPSLVPGMDYFIHLTQGFAVLDADGAPLCRLVDDITIREDLDAHAAPRPGWYRIVSDEPRLMRLVHRYADPAAPLSSVLDRLAEVFGVETVQTDGIIKVDDEAGATIAMAAPLPGERERPCEIITPPITHLHRARLDQLLVPARDLGFTVPAEAAVHLHLDAGPLRRVPTFANLVRLFSDWREPLRQALGTNPRCQRLAPLPPAVIDLVAGLPPAAGGPDQAPGSNPALGIDPALGRDPQWQAVAAVAAETGLTKYADVNLTALMVPRPEQDTVEIRCLPGSIDADAVIRQAKLLERLLNRCRDPRPLPAPDPGSRIEDLLETR